ncbi:uncharacterized protein LOC127788295 [Diospyros lotus]|uniref:uncharacterized protein LOC127788295 n=1 Tax=Diospyros lotus TaxID=55363 RepID=UPI00224E2647|nr:uncharacterized protein LOC127788295 [Diospyros lotus]
MELTQGEMEGKDLRIIEHPSHDHSLVLRESLQGAGGYGGGHVQVYCNGCEEPISSSSSSGAWGGGGAFYACPNSDCWFLLHKRCAELPPKIEHPSHLQHSLTLHPHPLYSHRCDICRYAIDGFQYRCSNCNFDVHVRCASMVLRIQERVDENKKIHQHSLIPLEMEAQFLCAACGKEHKGKSYLCPTCGFWANQICASAPTTVDLHRHPHPLALLRPASRYPGNCKICNEEVWRAYWVYFCSEGCQYSVHLSCLPLEEVENPNKDPKEDIILFTWPMRDESTKLMTQLIKNLSLHERHKRGTKILHCREDHPLIFVNKKIDESKDDQLCDGCGLTISFQFYHCAQCNFSLHEWCAKLPNELRHIFHPNHPLRLLTQQGMHFSGTFCNSCDMPTNLFVFCCSKCDFYLDLKCASLPRLIKHQVHDHNLALRRVKHPCNACGVDYFRHFTFFRCEACNFGLCIKCALLPFSVKHRYDKHPFALTYSPIKGQPDDYYCEICEENINSMYWFYHCIKCDQSLHPKCIYPIKRYWNMKYGARFEVNFHSHLLSFVCRPKAGVLAPCHSCGHHFRELASMAFDCEQCDFWMHHHCLYFLFQ